MMKKTLILAVVMMLALGVAGSAYQLKMLATLPDGSGGGEIQLGDPANQVVSWQAPPAPPYLGFAALVPGTDALAMRLFVKPEIEAYEAILWGTPDLVATEAKISLWCSNIGNDATLGRMLKPTDLPWMIIGPGGETLWTGVISSVGSATNPAVTLVVPIVKTGTPGRETAALYTLTQVPEPGSMIALCSGLIGLVGFGIRRRK